MEKKTLNEVVALTLNLTPRSFIEVLRTPPTLSTIPSIDHDAQAEEKGAESALDEDSSQD
jgi:hypothetical protein